MGHTLRAHEVLRGAFERYDEETNEELMRQSTYAWPHAFARMDAGADEILSRYGSNHIHAIPGDHVEDFKWSANSWTWTTTGSGAPSVGELLLGVDIDPSIQQHSG